MSEEKDVEKVPVTAAEPKTSKTLTKEQWSEIEAHIELDDMTTKQICEKYDITPSAVSQHLSKRLKNDGYHVLRGAKKPDVRAEIAKKIEEESKKRIESFENKRLLRIEETREKGYIAKQAIGSMANKILLELVKPTTTGTTPHTRSNDIKALRHLEKLVEENVQGRLRLLNADKEVDPESLPELKFRDLTDPEIRKIQEGSETDSIEAELDLPEPDEEAVVEEGKGTSS